MKIVLVATSGKRKNVVFTSDTLQTYTLAETVRLAKEEKIENVYVVEGKSGAYLRTRPSTTKTEHLEQLSVSSNQLFASANDTRSAVSTPAFSRYLQLYQYSLEKDGGPLIVIDGKAKITKQEAENRLRPHQKIIFEVAEKYNIDPYLLGAIIIDEVARFGPFEDITDLLAGYFIGINTSVGIAQIKIETARGLIKNGYYNPDLNDPKLSPDNIAKTSRAYLYQYVKNPKHSIFFAAARMSTLADEWKKFVNLGEKPEIIATLYSLPHINPHQNPKPNDRGLQIAKEFYQLAKDWLE